ncbi:MAG: uncharacterized protein A8A55_1564 [Amphiamblys sp. WSBS2006]|nr:MAG: uncharacterized protein A8A55_1564 [Amphiamblys sp. WSBS2006]
MGVLYREYDMEDVEKKTEEVLLRLGNYNKVSDMSYCPINIAGIVNAIRLLTEASRCYNIVGSEESDDEEETMRQYEDEDGSIDLEKLNRHYNMARLISTYHKKLQACAAELRDTVQETKTPEDEDLALSVENTRSTVSEFNEALKNPTDAIKSMNLEKRRKRIEARKAAADYIAEKTRAEETEEEREDHAVKTEEETQSEEEPEEPKKPVEKKEPEEPKKTAEKTERKPPAKEKEPVEEAKQKDGEEAKDSETPKAPPTRRRRSVSEKPKKEDNVEKEAENTEEKQPEGLRTRRAKPRT